MTARTPDVLAFALPDGVSTAVSRDEPLWFRRKIAAFQAERLAETGYVLVSTEPDDEMVERLAEAIRPALFGSRTDDQVGPATQMTREETRRDVRAMLAELRVIAEGES